MADEAGSDRIREVVTGVAHAYDHLLTVILGHASILETTVPGDDPARVDVEAIVQAAQRAIRVTELLRMVGRGDPLDIHPVTPPVRSGPFGAGPDW